jgi:hypothetical protein
MLNRETWRHSYGRKLYKGRLDKFELEFPLTSDGAIDELAIQAWVRKNPLWKAVGAGLKAGLPFVRQDNMALVSEVAADPQVRPCQSTGDPYI